MTTRRPALNFGAEERDHGGNRRRRPAEEEDRHEIGQDLTLLSVEELAARVRCCKDEIARLEADMVSKRASRSAADQFFKR